MRESVPPPPRLRVLVIDDDDVALVAIAQVLSDAGFEVHTLTSPIGATRIVVRNGIQGVVMDLNMPAIRGDKLAVMFRSNPRLRTLPVVLVSGEPLVTLQRIAEDLPDVQVLPKSEVRARLAAILQRAIQSP